MKKSYCKECQYDSLSQNDKKEISTSHREHISQCNECRNFWELHHRAIVWGQETQALRSEQVLNVAPSVLLQRVKRDIRLKQAESPKPQKSFSWMTGGLTAALCACLMLWSGRSVFLSNAGRLSSPSKRVVITKGSEHKKGMTQKVAIQHKPQKQKANLSNQELQEALEDTVSFFLESWGMKLSESNETNESESIFETEMLAMMEERLSENETSLIEQQALALLDIFAPGSYDPAPISQVIPDSLAAFAPLAESGHEER